MTQQTLVPYLTVQNLQQAVEFYQNAFGFKYLGDNGHGKENHASMQFDDAIIMFRPESDDTASKAPATLDVEASAWFILYCDDVDSLFEQAVAAGATVFQSPTNADWGERWCKVVDPNGHSWSFSKKL